MEDEGVAKLRLNLVLNFVLNFVALPLSAGSATRLDDKGGATKFLKRTSGRNYLREPGFTSTLLDSRRRLRDRNCQSQRRDIQIAESRAGGRRSFAWRTCV